MKAEFNAQPRMELRPSTFYDFRVGETRLKTHLKTRLKNTSNKLRLHVKSPDS